MDHDNKKGQNEDRVKVAIKSGHDDGGKDEEQEDDLERRNMSVAILTTSIQMNNCLLSIQRG
jgi:hypothetical protein